jgi:protein-S-isoprenylcysteine O-methyltransferase Ste14
MRASDFEFRYRFWIIGAIFWLGFSLYSVDPVNAALAIAHWLQPHTRWSADVIARGLFAFGALLTILAALLRTWATSFLRSEVVHDAALHSNILVADGPYRYVRNPLYLGTTLLTLGMGLMASRLGYAVIVFGILFFDLRLITREEAELTASQGETYRKYLATVPRLFPSLFPCLPASGARSQWMQAIQGEGFFWGFAAATIAFAITLNLHYFWITLTIAFGLYLWSYLTLKRKQPTS